jgi:divalent metal cation (Fe/Co/Zn/Cd) transporter
MNTKKDEGVRIVLFSVILNALLFLLKGTVGLLAYSTALQADAINSAGDQSKFPYRYIRYLA